MARLFSHFGPVFSGLALESGLGDANKRLLPGLMDSMIRKELGGSGSGTYIASKLSAILAE
ncbi:hypothetical protein GCM10027021_12690 [Dyella kyungheensis]